MPTKSLPSRHKPLAACVAAAFALAAPCAFATPPAVTNCYDSGPGSLRAAVTSSSTVSGDMINLSGLSTSYPGCTDGRISLTTGAIPVTQNDLTIQGWGRDFTITGMNYTTNVAEHDRIFLHAGYGTLYLRHITIKDGDSISSVGGCIASNKNVNLYDTTVTGCFVDGSSGASGGGVYAKGKISLLNSTISHNTAFADGSGSASGGGLSAQNGFSALYSTISNNVADDFPGHNSSSAGGVSANGAASIYYSTISANSATASAGGLVITGTATIVNSTISGNAATGAQGFTGGILFSPSGNSKIYNSTIAFNTARVDVTTSSPPFSGTYQVAAGLAILSITNTASTVTLQSTLIANNTYGASPPRDYDLNVTPLLGAPPATIAGTNNLVRQPASNLTMPAGNPLTGACPLLGPLRYNNSNNSSFTHALLSHSPGIDAGLADGLSYDERGVASFGGGSSPRVSGSAADIGAYEVQQNDVIFNTGFEGCP